MLKFFSPLGLLLLFPLSSFAAYYFVTDPGGGDHSGTAAWNPWSTAEFNASTLPTGGDTVFFTGDFFSTVVPGTDGTDNDAGRLVLDMTGATLNVTPTRLQLNGRAYLTILGGTLGTAYDGLLIAFNPNAGAVSHDITIDGFNYVGIANGIATFLSLNHVYNLILSNCSAENIAMLVYGDSVLNHDLLITGCYGATGSDVTVQNDVIHIGDAANVTIEKCKLINRAPGDPVVRHNDVIQTYLKDGPDAGYPTNWVVRYNWIEMQQTSGSGDNSWMIMQSMAGDPALKIYGNVFIGSGTVGSNGILVSQNFGGGYYLYNNTFIRHYAPDNTVRFLSPGILYAENNVGEGDLAFGTFVQWTMQTGVAYAPAGWDYNYFYVAASVDLNDAGPHGSISSDPLFTDYAGNDFSLTLSSPLRVSGDTSIGDEYSLGIVPGSTWPNPTLVPRYNWSIGAFAY